MAIIGITSCRKLEDYRQAVLHVGAEPRILDSSLSVDEALQGLDGLMLTGGDDVAPSLYGATAHPKTVEAEEGRDAFEIALVQAARARDLPMLAICRGIQVLNVACGGTLVQDIPSELGGAGAHQFTVPPHHPCDLAHEVWIDKGTVLATLLQDRIIDDGVQVNSRHHQAVGTVAPGFKVSATAPDGVIEAMEDPAARFCVAVQWHPENFWRTGEFRPLFEGFIEAASA